MGRAHEVRKAAMAKTAAAKTKLYSKFGKEILIAAKAGVPDPDMNLELKRIIERAKKAQVPADLIKRCIDKAKSGSAENYESVTYEGFGPGASTFIVECMTDNVNRTVSAVRAVFTKNHGKMGISGAVMHSYNHVAVITCEGISEDEALDSLLMAEIDIGSVEDNEGELTVIGQPSDLDLIRENLEKLPNANVTSAEVTYLPENDEYVTLSAEDKEYFDRMIAMFDEIETTAL